MRVFSIIGREPATGAKVHLAEERQRPKMVLPPSINATFLVVLIAPLIIGLLVGILIRSAIRIGIVLALLILLLIGLGIVTPDQVLKPLLALIESGSHLTAKVDEIAGYLPYSSATFLIGLVIGFLRT